MVKVKSDVEATQPKAVAVTDPQASNHSEDEDEDEEALKQQETTKVKKTSKAEENQAMQTLSDVVEEKQLDENKMKEAFLALRKQEEADKEAERKREKALAAVKVAKEDVDLIANEMELPTSVADRKLREAGGDVLKCLEELLV